MSQERSAEFYRGAIMVCDDTGQLLAAAVYRKALAEAEAREAGELNIVERVNAAVQSVQPTPKQPTAAVERLRVESVAQHENWKKIMIAADGRANRATARAEAAESTVAGLRRALEETRKDLPTYCDKLDCRAGRCLDARKAHAKLEAALAATSGEHERRLKSEALKQVAEEVYNRLNAKGAHSGARRQGWEAGLVDFADYLKAEANRLEAHNGR